MRRIPFQASSSYGSNGLASSIAGSQDDAKCLLEDSNDETDHDRQSGRSAASTSAAAAPSTETPMHTNTGRVFNV